MILSISLSTRVVFAGPVLTLVGYVYRKYAKQRVSLSGVTTRDFQDLALELPERGGVVQGIKELPSNFKFFDPCHTASQSSIGPSKRKNYYAKGMRDSFCS